MGGLSHVCRVARQVGLASSNTHNPAGGLGHGLIPAQPAQLPCLGSETKRHFFDGHNDITHAPWHWISRDQQVRKNGAKASTLSVFLVARGAHNMTGVKKPGAPHHRQNKYFILNTRSKAALRAPLCSKEFSLVVSQLRHESQWIRVYNNNKLIYRL